MATTLAAPSTARSSREKKKTLTAEQIQNRAYEIYLERGRTPGDPLQDWLRAERELQAVPVSKARKTKSSTKA